MPPPTYYNMLIPVRIHIPLVVRYTNCIMFDLAVLLMVGIIKFLCIFLQV